LFDLFSKNYFPFFVTSLRIAKLAEIDSLPHLKNIYWDPNVIAGAYWQVDPDSNEFNQIIFVDVRIFNMTGQRSQAALLLHEFFRIYQHVLGMSNFELQKTVNQILTMYPAAVKDHEIFKIPALAEFTLHLSRNMAPQTLEDVNRAHPPKDVIARAKHEKVLDEKRARGTLKPRGLLNRVSPKDGKIIFEPATCDSFTFSVFSLGLQCFYGNIAGSGILRFPQPEENFQIDARAWLADGSAFALEFLMPVDKVKLELDPKMKNVFSPVLPGQRISFQRRGPLIEIWFNSKLAGVIKNLNLEKFNEFSVRASKDKKKVSVLVNEVAIHISTSISEDLLKESEVNWEYETNWGVYLEYLRSRP
ncbi:MAG: hypothetical protein AB7O96_14160, partial [Pseudobdellovibrionaceae bacterium]